MGTSTWHRSPETEEWRHVRELYAQANPAPRDVVARIVAALDGETRAGLADPAVATCLGTLVEGAQLVAAEGMPATLERLRGGREPAALQMAAGLRDRAQRLVAAQGLASRFGDLALDAVGATALALATRHSVDADVMVVPSAVAEANFAGFARDERLHELAARFIGHELDRAFRYFVARDLGEFVGGPGLPTVGPAGRLEDAVAAHCRDTWRALDLGAYESALAPTLRTPPAERIALLGPVLQAGVGQGLSLLATGRS